MPSTLTTYRDETEALVPGGISQLSEDKCELDRAISAAMRQHSRHKPVMTVEDLDGAGSFAFACSGLDDWEDDFSVIKQVEYPVDDTDYAKAILDPMDWELYQRPAGKYLHLLNNTPAVGESVRVSYTARHTCTVTACTIPTADEDAVFLLCASNLCRILAAKNAQNAEPAFGADSAATSSMRQEYEAQAKQFYNQYCMLLGIQPNKPKPASVTMDQDLNYQGGVDRLTHGRRYR